MNDQAMMRLLDDYGKRISELEATVKRLQRNNIPTIPIYDNTNWPLNAVEGQIVIAPT
jgi:hypothetical protein